MKIQRAQRVRDLEPVLGLLRAADLPTAGVAESFEHFFVATGEAGQLLGSVGLELYGAAGLLRSLAVAPSRRRDGIGERLVGRVIEFAALLGVRDLYLLTSTASDYFPRLGFSVVPRQSVPAAVQASPELSEIRCAGAVAQHRALEDPVRHAIRRAGREDLPALVRLLGDLTITASPTAARRTGSMVDHERAFAAIVADPRQTVLVAEIDGEVVASLTILVVPNLSHRASPWAILENVIVDSRFRGKGLGRDLVTVAIRLAREAGCYKIGLTSNRVRGEAHAFYESLGFDPYAFGFRLEL